MKNLAIILTARMESARLPGKVVAEVCGEPLAYWIAMRLKPVGEVVLATTEHVADDPLEEVARKADVPCYRGSVEDVIGRMEKARMMYAPRAEYVLRALGDCPFMSAELVNRATTVMDRREGEAFQWHLAPNCHPVYGAREFPYHIDAWRRIVRNSGQREHVDMYFHEHRDTFNIVYHETPPAVYFREYRLEVDWAEDLAMVRAVAEEQGMLAPLDHIIGCLDTHPEIAGINRHRTEITGLSVSYNYQTQRDWMRVMEGKPVVCWNDLLWLPPSDKATPVFCQSGQCLLGFALNGVLYTKNARIRGEAHIQCSCGSGKFWHEPKGRGARDLGFCPAASMVRIR